MKILHTSDPHLDFCTWDGRTSEIRRQDFFSAWHALVQKAISKSVDIALIAGDVFHKTTPTTAAVVALLNGITDLVSEDIEVVIVAGNHDTPKLEKTNHPLTVLSHLPGVHLALEGDTQVFDIKGIKVAAVPFVRDKTLDTSDFPSADVALLHGSCTKLPEFMHEGEYVYDPEWGKDYKYVALGDWHRFEQVADNAYYSGALERTSFGEVDATTGAIFWEDGEIEYWKSPAREMYELEVEVGDRLVEDAVMETLEDYPQDSLFKVRVSGAEPKNLSHLPVDFLKVVWQHESEAPELEDFGPRSLIELWDGYCEDLEIPPDRLEAGKNLFEEVIEDE